MKQKKLRRGRKALPPEERKVRLVVYVRPFAVAALAGEQNRGDAVEAALRAHYGIK